MSLHVLGAQATEPQARQTSQTVAATDSAIDRTGASRWLPSLAVQSGILSHERDGETNSLERGTSSGDTRALFGIVGASAELATPRITFIPSRPRFFVHADVVLSRDNDEAVTNESQPGNPLLDPGNQLEVGDPVAAILGVGTSLRVQSEPLILSGGFGFAFKTDWEGREIRIKPSVEWMFQRDEMRLEFGHAESEGTEPTRCDPCRATSGRIQTTKGYHSVGPGIEIDIDAGRMGSFMFSLFTQFRALRILGDRQVDLRLTTPWQTRTVIIQGSERIITGTSPAVGREDSTITSRYRREDWGYYATAGLRVFWLPE